MRVIRPAIALSIFALLAGCAQGMGGMAAPLARGTLANAAGELLGGITVTPGAGDALRVAIDVNGLAPGSYGTHIHAVGKCEGPAFASAGGHWNPTMHQHGRMNPAGSHSGDLPNLTVGPDRHGVLIFDVPGPVSGLLDADGAAVIIHAHADDERTDPSGNSGDRVVCAVLSAG